MKYTKKILSSGLTIITIPKKDSLTATVLVLVSAGSKYETKDINGLSHFLEHMCFKGTKKRPSAMIISHELDSLGADYNAFTGQEYTGYYAKVDPTHIHKALDIVSDIYLNQVYKEKEIRTESGVIIEEINMYEDNPKRSNGDLFMKLLYKDQPAGWSIAGPKKTVLSMKRKDFIKYQKEHYVAEATTIVVAGKMNEKKVFEDIKRKFKQISTEKKKDKLPVIEEQQAPKMLCSIKKLDQTHIVVGVRAFSIEDKKVPILKVMAIILGGGMSSRLFSEIREKRGYAYYVYAHTDLYTDHGYLAVAVGANNENAANAVNVILKEFRKIKKTRVSARELKKVKDYMIGRLSLGLETSDDIAVYLGLQNVLTKTIKTPTETIAAIKKVTAKDIQDTAKEIFVNRGLNLALTGPSLKKTQIEKSLKI